MFKIATFVALITVAAARPGFLGHYDAPFAYEAAPIIHHDYLNVHEPVVAKVGAIVEHVPAAVSHQSQTIVHHSKPIVTPILAPTYHHTPLLKSFPSPLIYGFDDHHHYHHHY